MFYFVQKLETLEDDALTAHHDRSPLSPNAPREDETLLFEDSDNSDHRSSKDIKIQNSLRAALSSKYPPLTLWLSVYIALGCVTTILFLVLYTVNSHNNITDDFVSTLDCTDSCCIFCGSSMADMVQQYDYFNDSKYFVDMPMKQHPADILNAFNVRILHNQTIIGHPDLQKQAVRHFIEEHFDIPGSDITECVPLDFHKESLPPTLSTKIHDDKLREFASEIYALWTYLCRTISPSVYAHPERYSLIPLKHPQMLISGGRFREIYYWDSFWVIQGLLVCDMHDSAKQTLENLMFLTEQFGHTPNGNRLYYQNRSQPPLLTLMMNLIYEAEGNNDSFIRQHREFLYILKQDYLWWMEQQSLTIKRLNSEEAESANVEEEYTVNLYFVRSSQPRPEGYVEDMALVDHLKNQSVKARNKAFSAVRAGAEAGWDFSSRWCTLHFCADDLSNIDTLNIVPVELNAYFYRIEQLLATYFAVIGDVENARYFEDAQRRRYRVLTEFLWDETEGVWRDWNVRDRQFVDEVSSSNYFPLWVLPYDATMAEGVLLHLNASGLIREGGVATTMVEDGQQWDWPNAWPPIQYVITEIARRYGEEVEVARWIERNVSQSFISAAYIGWQESGFMHEKYDVLHIGDSGKGGEYTPQTGFGWTNAVAFSFLYDYGERLVAPNVAS